MSDRALRIALVTPRYHPAVGGVELVVARVAAGLAALGQRVEVLTQGEGPDAPELAALDGVCVRRFRAPLPRRQAQLAPSLWRYLARHGWRYDVVHAHNYHALPALAAALATRGPLVLSPHYHGTGHTPLRRLLHLPYRRCGRVLFGRAAAVICDSEAEAALVRRHFPDAAGRIQVLPPGIDIAALRRATPFPMPATDRVVLCSGRLEPYKGVDRLLEAMINLEDGSRLVVIGEGSARPSLEMRAARLDLGDRVRFLGRVDDPTLHRWLRTASVYASLSRREAYGLGVLEALAAGAPVLASAIPAFREHARHARPRQLRLVEESCAPRELAGIIRELALGGRPADATPTELPSWERIAEHTLAIYRTVVE